MAEDLDIDTARQERIFGALKLTMKDQRLRVRMFNHLCGVPMTANEAEMVMSAVDEFLNPKSKVPVAEPPPGHA